MKSRKYNYEGQQFGNRLIIKNYCKDKDWIDIGKNIPSRSDKYVLGKCLNCGSILPTHMKNLATNPPKRCVFCSNIGNHYNLPTNTNSWSFQNDVAICNVLWNKQVVTFYINREDYHKVCKYIWRIAKKKNKYYVITGSYKKNTAIYLHQLIFGEIHEGMEIDHIDGNSLNNRKENLRQVSHQENVDNIQATRIDNSIGIRGISQDKRSKKYTVDFTYHNKRYYFKPWDTIEEAVYCRKYAEEYFGLELVSKNPMFQFYQSLNDNTKRQIKKYVLEKIS